MKESGYHKSFLVTCLGAYDDSGVGTGGFVCVHEGNAIVIDRIDSTGLFHYDKTYYRFARGMRSIVGYDQDGVKSVVRLDGTRDGHDIRVFSEGYISVSTGSNEVCWYDAFGRFKKSWHADGERDAWHLNCLEEMDGQLYISAFGEFKTHRGWAGDNFLSNCGFIMNLANGERIVNGLNGPHNPRFIDGTWVVCDSHTHALIIARHPDQLNRLPLDGFVRGLTYDDKFYYVGESADRKKPIVADYSHIVIVSRNNMEIVGRIRIPFHEIYEIVEIPDELAATIAEDPSRFQLGRIDQRTAALEKQVERGFQEVAKLRQELQKSRSGLLYRLLRHIAAAMGWIKRP